jgi:hypothetical protein
MLDPAETLQTAVHFRDSGVFRRDFSGGLRLLWVRVWVVLGGFAMVGSVELGLAGGIQAHLVHVAALQAVHLWVRCDC